MKIVFLNVLSKQRLSAETVCKNKGFGWFLLTFTRCLLYFLKPLRNRRENAKNTFLDAKCRVPVGNSSRFQRTRAKSTVKHDTLGGGETRGERSAKRVGFNSDFSNWILQNRSEKTYKKRPGHI